jgi:hypothetical protein
VPFWDNWPRPCPGLNGESSHSFILARVGRSWGTADGTIHRLDMDRQSATAVMEIEPTTGVLVQQQTGRDQLRGFGDGGYICQAMSRPHERD